MFDKFTLSVDVLHQPLCMHTQNCDVLGNSIQCYIPTFALTTHTHADINKKGIQSMGHKTFNCVFVMFVSLPSQ